MTPKITYTTIPETWWPLQRTSDRCTRTSLYTHSLLRFRKKKNNYLGLWVGIRYFHSWPTWLFIYKDGLYRTVLSGSATISSSCNTNINLPASRYYSQLMHMWCQCDMIIIMLLWYDDSKNVILNTVGKIIRNELKVFLLNHSYHHSFVSVWAFSVQSKQFSFFSPAG